MWSKFCVALPFFSLQRKEDVFNLQSENWNRKELCKSIVKLDKGRQSVCCQVDRVLILCLPDTSAWDKGSFTNDVIIGLLNKQKKPFQKSSIVIIWLTPPLPGPLQFSNIFVVPLNYNRCHHVIIHSGTFGDKYYTWQRQLLVARTMTKCPFTDKRTDFTTYRNLFT